MDYIHTSMNIEPDMRMRVMFEKVRASAVESDLIRIRMV